jgi:16S rRNA (guanine527-N7)-methyltransferase
MAKRCRFLGEAVETLALPATVHNARAENLELAVDSVTARACAPLSRLLGYARPFLARGATGWFLKGQDIASELEEATKSWEFEAEIVPSLSDARGRIVRVGRLRRVRKA